MKKLISLLSIVSAIVFLNPAQAKADVRAYVYFNPLAWLFTPPVKVIKRQRHVYHRPAKERVVYVQPKRYKRARHSYYQPKRVVRNSYKYNKKYKKNRFNKRKYKRSRNW